MTSSDDTIDNVNQEKGNLINDELSAKSDPVKMESAIDTPDTSKEWNLGNIMNFVKQMIDDLGDEDEVLTCDICFSSEFLNFELLDAHKKNNHWGQTKCPHCEKVYSSKSSLRLHIKNLHTSGEKKFTCSVCGYSSNSKQAFTTHSRIHTGEKPFACDTCDYYQATDPSALVGHKRVCTDPEKRSRWCDKCGKRFNKISSLEVHKNTVHEGRLPCSVCGETFTSLDLLCQHKNSEHFKPSKPTYTYTAKSGCEPPRNNEPPKRYCDICDKEFSTPQSYRHHNIVAHTKEYPLICDGCGKGFTGTGLGASFEKHKLKCLKATDE